MATLTSTGNVNLTSSTNWSPTQIPAAGDDLVIGAHTLTLDADFTGAGSLSTVTFNNASSKLAISGTSRTVQATNGWFASANPANYGASVAAGTSVTLIGKWTINVTNTNAFYIINSTGGNVTYQTVGADQSAILFESTLSNAVPMFVTVWTAGTLTTTGRFNIGGATGTSSNCISMTGGTWIHQSSGTNTSSPTMPLVTLSGTSSVQWSGSLNVPMSGVSTGAFYFFSTSSVSSTIGVSGNRFVCTGNGVSTGHHSIIRCNSGTVTVTGDFSGTNKGHAFHITGGTINWRNQSATVQSSESLIAHVMAGTLDITGLSIANSGQLAIIEYATGTTTTSAGTVITCQSTNAKAMSNNANVASKIVTLPSPAPTLPAVQNVAASTVYGYAASPLTGTGLLVDPAILAAALQTGLQAALEPNAASIVERSTNDNKAITFSWPVSGATITGQKSIDNGAYTAVAGAITFLRTESNRHYYALAYNAADRNTVESSIRYKMTDGTYTKYFNLHVVPSGDVNVTLAPLAADQEPRNTRTRIIVYTGEAGTQYFFARDSQNNNLNLTGFNLELRFARGKSVIYTAKTTDGSLTISNGNQVNFARSSALTRGDGELTYALRDMGSGAEVLLEGPVTVRYAP